MNEEVMNLEELQECEGCCECVPVLMDKEYFKKLYTNEGVYANLKEKNGLSYLSWATAWAAVKSEYPDAFYHIHRNENGRFWFDDGKSGWVEVTVVISGLPHSEILPIMDFRNACIPVEKITAAEANKSYKRCLTKACAIHGLGLKVYEGEDLSDFKTPRGGKKKGADPAETVSPELKAKQEELTNLCKEKVKTVKRDDIYATIAKLNNGNKNIKSITTVELCTQIIDAVKKM